MDTATQKTYIMATRLKTLRKNMEYSHDRLSAALIEKYGVQISSDSLMSYEVTDPHHSKAGKNQGMRVEYLRILSDFYGVSTDYLLGLTNVKSINPDMRNAIEFTGLTQESIETIRSLISQDHSVVHIDILNWFLSNPDFTLSLISKLHNFMLESQSFFIEKNTWKETLKYQEKISNGMSMSDDSVSIITNALFNLDEQEGRKDLAHFRASQLFNHILEDFIEQFCDKNRSAQRGNDDHDFL